MLYQRPQDVYWTKDVGRHLILIHDGGGYTKMLTGVLQLAPSKFHEVKPAETS